MIILYCVDREAWTNINLQKVYDSAIHPLGGERFWTTAEEPFQVYISYIEYTSHEFDVNANAIGISYLHGAV
jgi:DNA-directed RNA polymerase